MNTVNKEPVGTGSIQSCTGTEYPSPGAQARLAVIWDYDGPVGQLNATYPYNFDEKKLLAEIRNVDLILETCARLNLRNTFAVTGFSAEDGHWPYHIPEQVRRIHTAGHEVASHSWRHEWFPHLQREQIIRSLRRSKYILEECIGQPGAVCGFVPPFSRPMSWYGRGAFSAGDLSIGAISPGANLGSLLRIIRDVGYSWCRVAYRPIWRKILGIERSPSFELIGPVTCLPHHYVGFDEPAIELLRRAVAEKRTLVVSAHPSGLSRSGNENVARFQRFFEIAGRFQLEGRLSSVTVNQCLLQSKNRI